MTIALLLLLALLPHGHAAEGVVGGRCSSGSQRCEDPHADCIEGICLCSSFYRFHNGSCVSFDDSATLGRPCLGGGDCRGVGEFCSSFAVCMCLSTHVDVGTQCKPAVYPGQFGCEDSRQCNKGFPGAECDASRICVCPHGMISAQQTCIVSSTISNVILSDDHRRHRARRPPANYYRRRYSQVFAQQPSPGIAPDAVCSADSDCAGYPLAFCDGVCRCASGALNAGSTCISSGDALRPAGSCPPGQTYVTEAGACMTVQQPGDPCQYSQQCSAVEAGAFCLRLRCECVYGMRQSGTGCTYVDKQCTEKGYIWISELGECRKVLAPGERGCSHNLQCTGAYPEATCFLQTCTCPASIPVAIDGTCGINCPSGQTYSGVTGQCLPTVKPGDQCLYSSQCHAVNPGMICDRGLCRCPSGLVYSGTKCTEACPAGYIVNSKGLCMPGCRVNQVEFEGECLDQVAPEQPCAVNAQCTGGSSCQNGLCRCPKAMVARGSSCVQAESQPSGSCSNGELCIGGSFCSNGACICPVGKQIVNNQCITPQAVDIGGGCVKVGVACGGGSICVAGYCVCPPGMTEYQNRCVEHRTAQPGESCDRGEECVGESTCDRNTYRCECISPTKLVIGGVCRERLRSHPGYPCGNGEMCVGGSTCIDARCACSDGKIEVNKQCVDRPTVGAGETCGNGENCGGGSECDYNQKKCICRRGQVVVNQQCVQVTVVNPGASCKENLVRCGGGSYCVRGRCECPATMLPVESKCVMTKQVPPGHACSVTEICQGKSLCKDGYCQCSSDMILVGNECRIRRKILPLESCHAGDECMGNSKCNGHVCECDPGHVVRDGTCQQRLTRNPGQRCNQEDLCIGLSVCAGGICQCRPGEKPISGTCTKIIEVLPGGACEPNDECQGGSSCRGGICMCPAGQTIVAGRCKEIVRVPPGTACSNGEICDGGSYCHPNTKLCRCPPGEMIGGNKCMKVGRRIPQIVPVLPRGRTPMSNSRPICRSNSECPKGAMCRNGLCACPQFTELRNGTCRPVTIDPARRRPGLLKEPCQTDSQCAVVNSYCSEIGVCGCLPGYRIFGSTQCIRRYVPSTTTTTTTTTTTASPSTTTTFSTTTSSRRTTSRPVEELLLPGSACNERSLCHYGSTCVQGRCRCPAGFAQIHNTCVRRRPNTVVPPLSSCAAGEICGGGSECIYSLCFCTDDRTLFRGECKTLIEIDEIRANEIVQIKATTVRLQRLRTTTPSTPTPSTGTIFTKLSTTTSAPTTSKSTQPPTKATTTTTPRPSTSRPPVSTTPSEPETIEIPKINTKGVTRKPVFWFKIARPGFECDEHTFCTNCSVCVGGLCACPEGLELVGEKCLSPVDAKSCLASNQCPSGAECVGGECRCSPGLALSRFGFCMPLTYVDPGMSCSEGETCRGGSECREGMCVCSEGLFIRNNKCMPAVRDLVSAPAVPRLTSCPSDGSCKLPNCFCSRTGTVPPGGLESQHVPQMVILTFDDPITDRTINIYKSMFSGKFRNPNGCPIKGTFFISHQFNNYDQTQWLYSRGNEIALNSITHENLFNASSERWRHEMVGLRDSLKAFSYVDESTVIGVRAPHLLIGGDQQFDMMKANGLVYDNSMPVREGPVWPQTLDHRLAWDCGEQKCPQKSHPGIWSIPLQLIASSDGIWHTMARTAIKPYDTRESVLRLLQRNFYRNYNGNRAPFVLTADSEFLTYLPDNGVVHALEDWLREILGKTDVYVVTGSQAIEWMKKPTSSRDIEKFKRWQCNFRMNDHVHPCENPSICSYDSRSPTGLPHSFRVCGSCPKTYPWIEDPLGRKHLRRK